MSAQEEDVEEPDAEQSVETERVSNSRIVDILNGIDEILDYVRDPMGKLAISDIKAQLRSKYDSFEESQESYRKDHRCTTEDGQTIHVSPTGVEVYQDGSTWRRVSDDEPYISEDDVETPVMNGEGEPITSGTGDPVTVAILKENQLREKIRDVESLQEEINELSRKKRKIKYEPIPRDVFTDEERLNMDLNPDLSLITWMISDE